MPYGFAAACGPIQSDGGTHAIFQLVAEAAIAEVFT
jgi:hypothetical protein